LSRLHISTALALVACALAAAPATAQNLVTRFEVANFVFSPDGDGVEESTDVTFTLGDSATAVSVVVFQTDSITPVDTLLAATPRSAGTTDLSWDGTYWDGTPAADGRYVLTLSATGATLPDTTVSRAAVVDTGIPGIVIDAVTPNPYAPLLAGAPSALDIQFTVTGASPAIPGVPPDEIRRQFQQPAGSAFTPDSLAYVPAYLGADGSYSLQWRAQKVTGLANGVYNVTLTIVDQAGHTAKSSHTFGVDSKEPELKITKPSSGKSYRVAPDSLHGWAWDSNGISGVDIRYSAGGPYLPVVVTSVVDDTVKFSAQISDSVTTEGSYQLTTRAKDAVGRQTTVAFDIKIDLTAPEAPTLDPVGGVSHTDTYRLTGDFPAGGDPASKLRIYRNGALIDSVLTFSLESIDRVVPLVPGRNVFTVTYVDGAGNESAPSNAVVVTFDTVVGVFMDVPFSPGDEFRVNLARAAGRLVVHVYDLTGGLVVELNDLDEKQYYAVAWNGRNGGGETVKKGPLVAVVQAHYADGGTDVFREVFLFEPNPK